MIGLEEPTSDTGDATQGAFGFVSSGSIASGVLICAINNIVFGTSHTQKKNILKKRKNIQLGGIFSIKKRQEMLK